LEIGLCDILFVMKYILSFVFAFFMITPVKADVFVWTDPQFDLTMSFPDDWMRQRQMADNLRLHVLAPQGADFASCRVFASDDGRFLYIPARGQIDVAQKLQDQNTLVSLIRDRMDDNKNVRLIGYQPIGGLGKGPATVALAQYSKTWNGKDYGMQSLQFAGYMNGLETVLHCESLAQSWGRWAPIFLNMVKSFDYPAQYGPKDNGYYRDFMADGYIYLPVGYKQGRKAQ
jgi:hypothetical protein